MRDAGGFSPPGKIMKFYLVFEWQVFAILSLKCNGWEGYPQMHVENIGEGTFFPESSMEGRGTLDFFPKSYCGRVYSNIFWFRMSYFSRLVWHLPV